MRQRSSLSRAKCSSMAKLHEALLPGRVVRQPNPQQMGHGVRLLAQALSGQPLGAQALQKLLVHIMKSAAAPVLKFKLMQMLITKNPHVKAGFEGMLEQRHQQGQGLLVQGLNLQGQQFQMQ